MKPAKALAIGDVPYYSDLSRYEWTEDFVKLLAIEEKIEQIADRVIATKQQWPTREEILEQAAARYEEYRRRRVQKIRQHVLIKPGRATESITGFVNFNVPSDVLNGGLILFEEFEAAVRDLDNEGRLVNQEKVDERLALLADMEALEDEAEALCPAKFSRKQGPFAEDIRRVFFQHWLKIQKTTNGPVGPRRVDLFLCPPQERAAWEKLGLDKHIGKNASEGPAAAPPDFFRAGEDFSPGGEDRDESGDVN